MAPTQRMTITTGHGSGDYHCTSVTVVDRPWLRSASFPVVPEGFRIITHARYATAGEAVKEMRCILDGRDDFASEYVYAVEVTKATGYRRTIRKRVEKARQNEMTRAELRVAALAAAAMRRGNYWRSGRADWDLDRTWDDNIAELLQAA
jgi:hypothetical protein